MPPSETVLNLRFPANFGKEPYDSASPRLLQISDKMTTKLTFKLSAAAALTLCALAVQAEESVQTSEVTVTAGRVEQQLLEVPMAVTVVTNQEIQKSSARNVRRTLEDIPGVMVNNAGSQGLKRVSIRGEDTFRTLTLIDGQKISEQKSMSGASILIDPNSIERIEVIKGPASVLYGSDALGGVVNIITKKDLRNLLKLRVRLLGTAPVTVGQKRFLSVGPIKV